MFLVFSAWSLMKVRRSRVWNHLSFFLERQEMILLLQKIDQWIRTLLLPLPLLPMSILHQLELWVRLYRNHFHLSIYPFIQANGLILSMNRMTNSRKINNDHHHHQVQRTSSQKKLLMKMIIQAISNRWNVKVLEFKIQKELAQNDQSIHLLARARKNNHQTSLFIFDFQRFQSFLIPNSSIYSIAISYYLFLLFISEYSWWRRWVKKWKTLVTIQIKHLLDEFESVL